MKGILSLMKSLFVFAACCMTILTYGQDLPFREIPAPPSTYSANTVLLRSIQGLGFRYSWATEGLRDVDLAFKPSEDGRTTRETLEHIHGLCGVIANAVVSKPNTSSSSADMSFSDLRKETLLRLKEAADVLEKDATDFSTQKIIFVSDRGNSEFPMWNLFNGPLEDAVWHVGQIITFRRSSGNPYNSKASVFTGKVRD